MTDMQFMMEMTDLRKHVNFVRNGLGSQKTDLPTLLMKFQTGERKVDLFTANKEMFARTTTGLTWDDENPGEQGNFSVLGERMERLISQVDVEKVYFKADKENLEVRAGHLTVNFELYDGASLRTIESGLSDDMNGLEGTAVSRSAFVEALTCARACTTVSAVRPDVTHVELRNGRMLSSDGRKVMVYSHDGFVDGLQFKCPANIIQQTLAGMKNIDSVDIEVAEGQSYYVVKANLGEYVLGVRKVERVFPALEGQIENKVETTDEVSIDKAVLEGMLKGVALGLPMDEVKVKCSLSGSGDDAYLEVESENSVGRKSFERAACGRKSSTGISFPVSFKHLLDTLSVFKGDSVVDLNVVDKMKLLMVRDSSEEREILTLIPWRTEQQIEEEVKEEEAAKAARYEAKEDDTDGDEVVADAVEGEQPDADLE